MLYVRLISGVLKVRHSGGYFRSVTVYKGKITMLTFFILKSELYVLLLVLV